MAGKARAGQKVQFLSSIVPLHSLLPLQIQGWVGVGGGRRSQRLQRYVGKAKARR